MTNIERSPIKLRAQAQELADAIRLSSGITGEFYIARQLLDYIRKNFNVQVQITTASNLMESEQLSGFTYVNRRIDQPNQYIIFLNSYEQEERMRWTLVHELCHVLLDIVPNTMVRAAKQQETIYGLNFQSEEFFCDSFVSAIFMPSQLYLKHWTNDPTLTYMQRIYGAAKIFGVSPSASKRRALELRLFA